MLGIGVFLVVTERGRVVASFRAIGRAGIAIAALMAISSGSFIAALNHTSVANVLFLQGLAPVLAAVFGMALGERVSRRTWVAMVVAVAGVAVMGGGPSRPRAPGFALSGVVSGSFAGTIGVTRPPRPGGVAPPTWAP